MKKSISAALLILALLVLPASAQVNKCQINEGSWVGCVTEELFEEVTGYIADGDKEAYTSVVSNGLVTGECTIFEGGETVFLEDTAIWSGMSQVRRQGETLKYWTYMEAVDC